MDKQSSTIITRKARIWPEISKETVPLPQPPMPPQPPQATMLTTVLFSLVGIGLYALVLSHVEIGGSSLTLLPFIAISGLMGISSLFSFIVQTILVRRRTRKLMQSYQQRLLETEKQLQVLLWKERQSSIDLQPPFVLPVAPSTVYEQLEVIPLIQRGFDNQDVSLWARRQGDPDFLTARIGMGNRAATFQIRGNPADQRIAMPDALEKHNEFARDLVEQYKSLVAPLTVKLDDLSPVSIVGSQQRLAAARELLHAMVSQVVYHHSPEDVRIIILAPQSQEMAWQWAAPLPHTIFYDPHELSEDIDEATRTHAVAIGTEAALDQLPLISRELARRELLLGDVRQPIKMPLLPHLLIVVDHFDMVFDLDQPTLSLPAVQLGQTSTIKHRPHLSVSPLRRPEMTLALSRNIQLGVSVLCACASAADVPTASGVMIDLDAGVTPRALAALPISAPPVALVRELHPNPPSPSACQMLDIAPIEALNYFSSRVRMLQAVSTKRLELRTQVDLRVLFEPQLDLDTYNPFERWGDALFRMPSPSGVEIPRLRIPIGLKIGDEVQHLDLLKDGPHGLLIGQTGSGKSELLQTIITSLAVAYHPTEVNFLLIDYKAGLALEPFRFLPHTVGFLSNVSSTALIQRFITMLKAEATRREMCMKEGKPIPRLVIIIDEFAEMAKRTEAVLDELFTITRVGREIGMHLLLAAQRPEGIIGSKVRDYVQYRLCLRCASPEDSREILRRVDAANLPASIPGRGFLLHGDNQLDMFQAARVAMPVIHHHQKRVSAPAPGQFVSSPGQSMYHGTTISQEITRRITAAYSRENAHNDGISFWPEPLPTPVPAHLPDPLVLFRTDQRQESAFALAEVQEEPKPLALVPVSLQEIVARRARENAVPSMQIPLGLIDKPETQQRETFLIDLHGSAGALTGGPLLIVGAQHSGKATAVETLLFWLAARYPAQQFRSAVIDPLQEIDHFQVLPHLHAADGASLWSSGTTDEEVTQFVERINQMIMQRRESLAGQRLNNDMLAQLWAQKAEMPQLLVIISHYHSFLERPLAAMALKKLALTAIEARNLGVYLVITSVEIGPRYLPTELMGKFSAKVGLFLNEQQRFELFGKTPLMSEPVPGRGLVLTADRSIHQVQLALPVPGLTESQRSETMKQNLLWLSQC
ncbi:MAG: FtsK/SpoIIIE domain-containing protein [Ktedonobacteraceae bacterium]